MKEATVDAKKRIVLPTATPGAHVTIEQPDEHTWVVRRYGKHVKFKRVLIPVIETIPDDPDWEKIENAFAQSSYKDLIKHPPPKD